jgi:hypothetical protein
MLRVDIVAAASLGPQKLIHTFFLILHTRTMAAIAPTASANPHWTIHEHPGVSRGCYDYKISRDDLPDTGQVDLFIEHLVWAGALSPGDRIKMVGSSRTDDVFTIKEIPSSDTWQDAGNEKIYLRNGDTEMISRKEIEHESGVRGLGEWAVDLRDEGWTPLTMVTERLIHYHALIDSWRRAQLHS